MGGTLPGGFFIFKCFIKIIDTVLTLISKTLDLAKINTDCGVFLCLWRPLSFGCPSDFRPGTCLKLFSCLLRCRKRERIFLLKSFAPKRRKWIFFFCITSGSLKMFYDWRFFFYVFVSDWMERYQVFKFRLSCEISDVVV